MDINAILNTLGLDLSDPETKRGALEAIEAILDSRKAPEELGGMGGSMLGNQEIDIEIDPDLLQPTQKHENPQSGLDDLDIEINDEDDVLKQVKQTGNSSANNGSDSEEEQDNEEGEGEGNGEDTSEEPADSNSEDEEGTDNDNFDDENSDTSSTTDNDSATEESEDSDKSENSDSSGSNGGGGDDSDESGEDSEQSELGDADENESSDDESEEDILDDTFKDIFKDKNEQSKQDSRRIKRERTLHAAKKALDNARARKVSSALIHELESAIYALESIKEAKEKRLADLSDEEFDLVINRVFDAIDAVGDTDLTYTSNAERELQANEIKNDLSSASTRNELSAEDIAQIRAETQAVRAREKENDKYKQRSRSSFKGFQEFLKSLYRAIALQVQTDEIQDDTWSAINRRHSGSGVLQPGKKITELPNKKIPVIDFYFDCSGSWEMADINIGKKAVESLIEMEEKGQIKINIYYFSNNVFTDYDSARNQGGTAAWNDIVKNVIATQASNVIIMTDGDMEDWWNPSDKPPLHYTVPGYVWYLWRYGDNAPRLPRDLKGRGGTQQFSFDRSD